MLKESNLNVYVWLYRTSVWQKRSRRASTLWAEQVSIYHFNQRRFCSVKLKCFIITSTLRSVALKRDLSPGCLQVKVGYGYEPRRCRRCRLRTASAGDSSRVLGAEEPDHVAWLQAVIVLNTALEAEGRVGAEHSIIHCFNRRWLCTATLLKHVCVCVCFCGYYFLKSSTVSSPISPEL